MLPILRIATTLLGLSAALVLDGCADEVPYRKGPSLPDGSARTAILLAHLTANDAELPRAASAIATSKDLAARREASLRLVAAANTLGSTAWRDSTRLLFQQANATAGVAPTQWQLEAQLDRYRDERLGAVLRGMMSVGGPEVIAYCFWLGENESAPRRLRHAALDVLVRNVDRRDTAAVARGVDLWDRLMAKSPITGPASPGSVTNASAVVAAMEPAFRSCYNRGLLVDANLRGSARLTGKIGPNGEVLSVSPSSSGLFPEVVACLVSVVASARFAPPEGGGATIVIPVTFVTN